MEDNKDYTFTWQHPNEEWDPAQIVSVSGRIENITKKQKNIGQYHVLIFSAMFRNAVFIGIIKTQLF